MYRHHRHRARRLAVPKTCPRIARLRLPRLEESKSACVHAIFRTPSATTDRRPLRFTEVLGQSAPGRDLQEVFSRLAESILSDSEALLDQEGLGSHQKGPFCRYLSPLPDSNRGPPPYHGGFELQLHGAATALISALSLQLGWFFCPSHHRLEAPRASPKNPKPVPKTCPQESVLEHRRNGHLPRCVSLGSVGALK
jgi:hypothetical protein